MRLFAFSCGESCARRASPVYSLAPRRSRLAVRDEARVVETDYDETEDHLKALQSVGQIIGEVLRQLDEERCEFR